MTELALVGTGLAGMTAALALAESGENITLIGPVPHKQKDDRTTAILAPGIALLKSLDLWTSCAATAVPLMTMELNDRGRNFIYDASETVHNEFGFNIANHALKQALIARLKKHKKITWLDTQVTQAVQKNGQWHLILANKKSLTAKTIIAADGRHSLMRDAANIPVDEKSEDQTALVTIVQASQPHHNTSVEWYRDGGPLTLVPMQDGKLAIVWCERDNIAREKTTLTVQKISKELTDMTEKRFGMLKAVAPLQMWPITPMKATHLVKNNVILIGEAGHVLPPIGAQGYNTSLHDIEALVSCITRARAIGLPLDDAAILSTYEKARLSDVTLRYHGMTHLNNLIRAKNPLATILRRFGLNALDRLPPLRRRVMQFGIGNKNKGHAA